MDSTSPAAPRSGRPSLRIGDRERERTAAVVGDAAAAGYIGIEELDGRLEDVWAARTAGELDAVVADLPVDRLHARPAVGPAARSKRGGPSTTGFRAHLSAYIGVMALLVGVWLAVGIAAGSWYPWFVWPALGWGIGVTVDGICTRARVRSGGAPGLGCGARHWGRRYAHHVRARHPAHGGAAYGAADAVGGAPWPPTAHRH